MTRYAEYTKVPVAKTQADIQNVLDRYGASGFIFGQTHEKAVVGFSMNERQVKFLLPLPDQSEIPSEEKFKRLIRQRWRALLLVIKSKLESVETGILTFDQEFMANIVLPSGELVGQVMVPQIERAYTDGKMPPLLPDYSGEND